MDEWGVDLAVTGSQKGFMLPPGLGMIGVSAKAMAAARSARMRRAFFDFAEMARMNATGYFPDTPPIPLLHGLRKALDLMLTEGLENVFARHHRLATGVRKAVAAWGMDLCAEHPSLHSDTVSAIRVPQGIDART